MLNEFVCPMDGNLLDLTQVPDKVFADKIMGDGFAIDPANGEVISPVTGTVTIFMDTPHAIGITSDDGLEVLIHIGIDTVKLEGEGFTAFVKQDDRVETGQLLLRADLDLIRGKVPSLITPVVFTNLPAGTQLRVEEGRNVLRGETGFLKVK